MPELQNKLQASQEENKDIRDTLLELIEKINDLVRDRWPAYFKNFYKLNFTLAKISIKKDSQIGHIWACSHISVVVSW